MLFFSACAEVLQREAKNRDLNLHMSSGMRIITSKSNALVHQPKKSGCLQQTRKDVVPHVHSDMAGVLVHGVLGKRRLDIGELTTRVVVNLRSTFHPVSLALGLGSTQQLK